MYKRIVHYLQGSQLVQIQCACPERVLNLLGAKGILFWDLQWESEICLRLRMLLEQGPALEEIAGQTGAEMTVLRRPGDPGPVGTVSQAVRAFGGVRGLLAAFIRREFIYMGVPGQRQ